MKNNRHSPDATKSTGSFKGLWKDAGRDAPGKIVDKTSRVAKSGSDTNDRSEPPSRP